MRASSLLLGAAMIALMAVAVRADAVPHGYKSTISFAAPQCGEPQDQMVFSNPLTPLITATATATDGPDAAMVFSHCNGLGVVGNQGDPYQVDGQGGINGFETLWIQFNTHVGINSITLANVGSVPHNDQFILLVGGPGHAVQAYGGVIPGAKWSDLGVGTITFEQPIEGTKFGLTVPRSSDDYSLREMSVTAMPLPAAVWGGLALLGGLAVRRFARRLNAPSQD